MPTVKVLLGAAVTSVSMIGLPTQALANQQTQTVQGDRTDVELRSRATNGALLQALLERRAEVARMPNRGESHRAALNFLDKRIAELKNRIEK